MKRASLLAFPALIGVAALLTYPKLGRQDDGSYLIPTGQRLTPAGKHIEVNDRPLGMVLSRDGSRLAVVTGSNFAPRALHILDAQSAALLNTVPIGDSFVGVTFSADGRTLYVGGGASDEVKVFRDGVPQDSFKIAGSAPSGLSLDGSTLYVALNLKHAIAAIDLETRKITGIPVGMHPYTALAAAGKVYVSNWAGRRARPGDTTDELFKIVVDPRTGIPSTGTLSVIEGNAVIKDIEVGLHPSALAASPKGDRIYVANANSDTVSIIDTSADTVLQTISVRPGTKAPIGSSPNALALSPDGKTLYVANAANNAVAVVDVASREAKVRGFLPTGWYPTAVAAPKDGKRIWVASGYGFGSIAPVRAGQKGRSYRDRAGVVSLIDVPDGRQLARATDQVMSNNRLVSSGVKPDAKHPVPMDRGKASPVRHVFYIIKENRTYDQVFGDLPQGNGDASLVQFGRDVSPNHHALAEQFVLLDNFYTPADQSALGHRWCTQGYASDWLFKYGNARNDQNPMLFAPNDFIWDVAKAHGVTVHSFGERGVNTITPKTATFLDILKGGNVAIEPHTYIMGLKDVYDPEYPAFGGIVPEQYRVDVFSRRFRQWEKDGKLPRLVVMLLPNDHTNGTSPGYPTPRAAVADNDLALGRIVEVISKSRYWKESAIFVTEDDAQNGYDHVAGHRTIALAASPWIRRKAVDSHFYTTINLYRTMLQILGLPPQNQFDAAAEPMFSIFTDRPDFTPYTALPNKIPLDELNPPLTALSGQVRADALASMRMDFSEPDAAPEQLLNQVIWRATMRRPVPR